jgi:hypothetical protein
MAGYILINLGLVNVCRSQSFWTPFKPRVLLVIFIALAPPVRVNYTIDWARLRSVVGCCSHLVWVVDLVTLLWTTSWSISIVIIRISSTPCRRRLSNINEVVCRLLLYYYVMLRTCLRCLDIGLGRYWLNFLFAINFGFGFIALLFL